LGNSFLYPLPCRLELAPFGSRPLLSSALNFRGIALTFSFFLPFLFLQDHGKPRAGSFPPLLLLLVEFVCFGYTYAPPQLVSITDFVRFLFSLSPSFLFHQLPACFFSLHPILAFVDPPLKLTPLLDVASLSFTAVPLHPLGDLFSTFPSGFAFLHVSPSRAF